MLEEFFKFPTATVDGDNEDRKQKAKSRFGDVPGQDDDDNEYDIIFGEAEYPYWDFIGIEDRWLPSTESIQKAMNGHHEACVVRFANAGQLLVPWSKKKFKAELIKFAEAYEANKPTQPQPQQRELKIVTLTPEQFKKMTDGSESE